MQHEILDVSSEPSSSSQHDLTREIQQGEALQEVTEEKLEGLASSDNVPHSEAEPITAIFRPGPGDSWREQLRLASENARLKLDGVISQEDQSIDGTTTWDISARDEEDDLKDDDEDEADDDNITGDGGEGGKVWRAKKTLRK